MRSKTIPILFGCTMAAFLTSCGQTTPTTTSANAQYPLIVRLQSRHYSIAITAGPHSPVYSITSATGELLAENMSLKDLQHTRPDLYNLLAPALAPVASASVDTDSAILSADVR